MNIKFNKNEDQNKLTVADLRKRLAVVRKGGGEKRIKRLNDQGKLTARERIDYLLDKDAKRIEIAAFAGEGMYEERSEERRVGKEERWPGSRAHRAQTG